MTPLGTAPDELARDAQPVRLGRKRDHSRDPEILEAALDVLAEQGYERLTIDLVAARVKAGKATLYRRWPSKAELVIDAVACMKPAVGIEDAPDTGTLRGDLVALIRPHSLEETERKVRIMGGVASMLSRDPQLADAVHEAITGPRARLNRALIDRAIARGEVAPRPDAELEMIAHLQSSMAIYRTVVQRQPIDRAFSIGVIAGVLLPALGLRA